MAAQDKHTPEEKLARLQKTLLDNQAQLARLKQENQTQAQRLKLSELFRNFCPVGLVLLQADRILEINPAALEQLDYQAAEIQGRAFWDFVDPASRTALKRRAQDRRKGKWVPARLETTLVRKDGTRLECEIRLQRFRFQGHGALLLGLIARTDPERNAQDLTEFSKTQALLALAPGIKKQLASELLTLRENVLLLNQDPPADPDSLKTVLKRMQNALEQTESALTTLDDLARTGYDPDELTLFDLRTLLQSLSEQILPLIQAAEQKTQAPIRFKTFLRTPARIQGHFLELREALLNLLRNALAAMPHGGELYLSTEENADQALIYIQASGGPSETLPARSPDDPGLPLSLAAAVMQRHHGTLNQNSPDQHGTLFTVKLPVWTPEQIPPQRIARPNIKNASILLIDAQDLIRPLLAQLLTSKGLKVVLADSSREALVRLKARAFDLVWIGTLVPDMPKPGLLQEIKKLQPQIATAVVLDHPDQTPKITADLILLQPLDVNKAVAQVLNFLRGKNNHLGTEERVQGDEGPRA
jgi:PAS domain S-box-containing protein